MKFISVKRVELHTINLYAFLLFSSPRLQNFLWLHGYFGHELSEGH